MTSPEVGDGSQDVIDREERDIGQSVNGTRLSGAARGPVGRVQFAPA
jgi:hypothetical protein